MKPKKHFLLFDIPVKSDWAFWGYVFFTAINSFSSYQQYYAGASLSGPGFIAALIDLIVFPLLGTYLILLLVLVPRFIYRKTKSREDKIEIKLETKETDQVLTSKINKNFGAIELRGSPRKIVLIISTVAVVLIAEQVVRNWEVNRFISKVEESESVLVEGISKRGDISRNQWNSQLNRWDNFEYVEDLFSKVAQDTGPKLAAVHSDILYLRFLPWHNAIENSRSDYLKHSQAWMDYYKNMAVTGDSRLWSEELGMEINNTFAAFCNTAPKSVPIIDIGGYKDRFAEICAE